MMQLQNTKLNFNDDKFGKEEIAEMELYNKFDQDKLG